MTDTEIDTIYRQHYRQLHNFAARRTDTDTYEDIVSGVFERFISMVQREPPDDPTSYLFRMVRNACVDVYRHRNRKSRPCAIDDVLLSTPAPELPDDSPDIWEQVESLSPMQQRVLRLHFRCGHSLETVAAMMGKSHEAIKGILHRAKSALREQMGAKVVHGFAWTKEENTILVRHAKNMSIKQLANLLPGRTEQAIRTRIAAKRVQIGE